MFLKVENITTGYGKKQVLNNVSFEINKGENTLISGGNGSGKSTVLKTIYGLLKPWTPDGKILFEGDDITSQPTASMIKRGIVYMPQKKNVFEDFTVEENLLTSASIYPRKEAKERIEKVYEMLPRLKEMQKRTPFNMSGGERQMLALAFGIVLIHIGNAKIFLLDEPFAGIDADNQELLSRIIQQLSQEKEEERVTFIIVEHRIRFLGDFFHKEIKLNLGELEK